MSTDDIVDQLAEALALPYVGIRDAWRPIVTAALDIARRQEREECAKVAQLHRCWDSARQSGCLCGSEIVAAIVARGGEE